MKTSLHLTGCIFVYSNSRLSSKTIFISDLIAVKCVFFCLPRLLVQLWSLGLRASCVFLAFGKFLNCLKIVCPSSCCDHVVSVFPSKLSGKWLVGCRRLRFPNRQAAGLYELSQLLCGYSDAWCDPECGEFVFLSEASSRPNKSLLFTSFFRLFCRPPIDNPSYRP